MTFHNDATTFGQPARWKALQTLHAFAAGEFTEAGFARGQRHKPYVLQWQVYDVQAAQDFAFG